MSEAKALRWAVYASLLIGVTGVIWGLWSDSRIVLFDGIYTVFGTALSGLSLLAAWAAGLSPDKRYPFGRGAAIPVAIVIQGAALTATLVYAAVDSISLLLEGGSDAAPLSVIAYGVITLLVSLAVVVALPRLAPGSELVAAEAAQWKAGAVLSGIIAGGAGVAAIASALGARELIAYADPVLVLIAVVVLAPVPWRLLRAGGREILEAAPPPAVNASVEAAAERTGKEFGLGRALVRSTKLGRRLYVEVDFVVEPGAWDVSDEDKVRRSLIGELDQLGYDLWANVELTTDPQLAE